MHNHKSQQHESPQNSMNVISFIEDEFDFTEDNFDLTFAKKTARTKMREKARIKRVRLQLIMGRIALAIAAFLIFFLIYYVIYAW